MEIKSGLLPSSNNNTQVNGHIDQPNSNSTTQQSEIDMLRMEDQQEQIDSNDPILAKRLLRFDLGKREIGVMFALSNIIYVPTAFFIQYIPKRYVQKHTIISISILLTPVGVLLIGANSLSSITLGILMLGFFPTPLWIFLLPSMQEDCSNLFANQCQKRRLNYLTAGIYNFFITLGQIVGYIIGPLANQRYGATTTSQMVAAFIFIQFFVYCFGVAMSDRSTAWRKKGRRRGRYFARYIV
jgi:cyanate permease